MHMKISVRAADLPALLDQAPDTVRILSLDCFDTLLWRNAQAPHDVFAALDIPGGAIWPRVRAEQRARKRAAFAEGRREVTIDEIYRSLMPHAADEEVKAAVVAELEAEARHCFAFAPTVALMRAAKARGLDIIIVSDTYLEEPQLRDLIAQTAGAEVAEMIDRVFCSCQYGMSKADGLFRPVVEALGVCPTSILHVGDNQTADQVAPSELGVSTAHLRQFDPDCEQRLRLEAAAAAIIDPATRITVPAHQPHRPQLSLRGHGDAAWALGHDVLGPILQAFAGWVRQEIEETSARLGKAVKPLFLLRDGHLPQRAFEALHPDVPCGAAEISRFTARRAALTDRAAIEACLAAQGHHGRLDVLARQLGLSAEEGRRLAGGKAGRDGQDAFGRAALAPRTVEKITARSRAFADRLFAHLKRAGIERGDAVMMIDLGYNGSVQNEIGPLLADRFDLTVVGRYLLLREDVRSDQDKKGFLDCRHYDLPALHALCGPIAVIEQLCTIATGSTVDYDASGAPSRKAAGAKGAQNAVRDRVQQACIAFAREAVADSSPHSSSDNADCRRRAAAAALARLLFMPQAGEIALLQAFEHDVNLGTDDMIQMMDGDEAANGLRRRGLFYLSGAERMFLPGEIQAHGLPLTLSLFSANRFSLDLRASDFRTGTLKLPVILADDRGQTIVEVDAHATHDGYYLATVPIGAGRFAAGIQFGQVCEWLQIEDASFYPVDGFSSRPGEEPAEPVAAQTLCEGMTEEAPGFYRCAPGALMLAPPPRVANGEPHLLAVVFRPLVARAASALKQAA
jgi:FMN phosphatase YigB (HAD superfamily)